MKKTMTMLLAVLMLGGEVQANVFKEILKGAISGALENNSQTRTDAFSVIINAVGSGQTLNVTDQQILEALPVYIRRASSRDSLTIKEMWGFFYNRGLDRRQQKLIKNWIANRANVNTNPFEVWVLGCMLYDGYAGELNKQGAINLHRTNARLGYTFSAGWLRGHGLGY